MARTPKNLEELLDRIAAAADDRREVSLAQVLETVGTQSFGPLLLIPGLLTVTPLSGIPGLPTVMGILIAVIAAQLLFCRDHVWLPQWIRKRTVSRKKLCKALAWLRKPSRFIDRLIRPRLPALIHGPARRVIALVCGAIGLSMPPLEILPFVATSSGAVITIFGLAMIARDGLLALLGFVIAGLVFGFVGYTLI